MRAHYNLSLIILTMMCCQSHDSSAGKRKLGEMPFFTSNSTSRKRGKIRGTILPQTYSLLHAVRHITNPDESWTTQKSACEWFGVICNSSEEVTIVVWSSMGLKGNLTYTHLPPTVGEVNLFENNLCGPLPLEDLYLPLQELALPQNMHSGSLVLNGISLPLRKLSLQENNFSGTLDLTSLPSSLKELRLQCNHFEGGISLEKLPASLVLLSLSQNLLVGQISLSSLPSSLKFLYLQCNRFSKCVGFSHIPHSLRVLNITENLFDHEIC